MLVVTKMDRLGRNAIDVAIMVDKLAVSTAVRMRVYSAIFGFDGTPGDAEAAAAHW